MLPLRGPPELWWAASIAIPLVAARAALDAIVFNADRLGISSFIVGIIVFSISLANLPSLGDVFVGPTRQKTPLKP